MLDNNLLLSYTTALLKKILYETVPHKDILMNFFSAQHAIPAAQKNIMMNSINAICQHFYKIVQIIPADKHQQIVLYVWQRILGYTDLVKSDTIAQLPVLNYNVIEFAECIITALRMQYTDDIILSISNALSIPRTTITLRINTLKTTRPKLLALLNHQHVNTVTLLPTTVIVTVDTSIRTLLKQGLIAIQQEASQLSALLLMPNRHDLVVDFCAGSGGKTLVFGARMRNMGKIYAFDTSQEKLTRLALRTKQAGLSNVYTRCISDEEDPYLLSLTGKVEKVFVDVPCLGLGTIQSHPELKLRYRNIIAADIDKLATQQLAILTAASRLVKKNGLIVYATCSILPIENASVVQHFLAKNPNFMIVSVNKILQQLGVNRLMPTDYLQFIPTLQYPVGFFSCVMSRIS